MASLSEIRAQYPQYNDMSDMQLATSFHKKFYADLPFGDFAQKIGFEPQQQGPQQPPQEQAAPWYTPFTSAPGNAWDMAKGLGEGVAGQVSKLAHDPRRLNPLVAAYQDVRDIAAPIAADPQGAYDAAKQGLDQGFGTPTRAWNTIATHPVDTLMLAAPGVGQLGKAAELGGMARTGNLLKATGAAIDPVNLVVKPIEKFSAMKAGRTADANLLDEAPTQEAVAADANAKWDAIRAQDIKFPAKTFAPFSAKIRMSFGNIGKQAAPQASSLKEALVSKLGPMPVNGPTKNMWGHTEHSPPKPDTRSVSFNDIEEIRRSASKMSADGKMTEVERKVAGDLVKQIEGYYETVPGLNEALKPAREMSRRNILARDIGKMQNKSEWYLAGDESGLKNQVSAFGKREGENLTPAEKKAYQKIVRKEGVNSFMSTAGGRLGQLILGGVGASLGGLPGMLGAGAAHLGARKLSEAATMKALTKAQKTVLLGIEKQKLLGTNAKGKSLNKLIVRGLLGSHMVQP